MATQTLIQPYLSDVLSGLDLHHPPCQDLLAN